MKRLALLFLLVGCGESTPAASRKTTPPPDPLLPLTEAAARGDAADLERAALRLGESGLVAAMDDGRRRVRLAARDAAALGGRPVAALGALVDRLGDTDRESASRAAAAALRVTETDDARRIAEAEVDPDVLAAAGKRAVEAAADVRLEPGVRVAAATIASRLVEGARVKVDPGGLVALLGDADVAVRRGVAGVLRAWGHELEPHRAALERHVASADDVRTSLLAAAALCAAGPLPPASADRARTLLQKGRASDRALLATCL